MSNYLNENNPYFEIAGVRTRREYLEQLAEERGWDEEHVLMMADMLGPEEDFDGLISVCEDFFGM